MRTKVAAFAVLAFYCCPGGPKIEKYMATRDWRTNLNIVCVRLARGRISGTLDRPRFSSSQHRTERTASVLCETLLGQIHLQYLLSSVPRISTVYIMRTRTCLVSDDRHGTDRDPCRVPGPSGGHVQTGRDPLPNNRQRIVLRRGEAPPIELLHKVAVSNNLHATYSGLAPDTNNRLPTRTRGPGLEARRELRGGAVAGQF